MAQITSAAPQLILNGFKDVSTRRIPPTKEKLPQHLPLVYTYAGWGPTEPQVVVGSSLTDTYGSDVLDYKSDYCTHATVLLNKLNQHNNSMMVQRLLPDDAKPEATLCFGLDLLQTQVTQYERNPDGTYKKDTDGNYVDTGNTVPGYIGKWVVTEAVDGIVGQSVPAAGSMMDGATQSIVYPMFDLQVSFVGKRGNNIAARFFAPTTKSTDPINEDVALDNEAYVYRVQFLQRADAKSSPSVIETLNGEQYVDFCFKPGALNQSTEADLYVDNVVIQGWRDTDTTTGQNPIYGPFESMYVYHTYVEQVSADILGTEAALSGLPTNPGAEYLINLFTALNIDGTPYYSFQVMGTLDGGAAMTQTATHYAAGGDDGTMSNEAFDASVASELDSFGDGTVEWRDLARYPCSIYYDTGFTLPTKKKIFRIMSVRRDMSVTVSTQDISLPPNSISDESSIAVALRAAATMFPESEVMGTPTTRATIMGHCGDAVDGYTGLVPMTVDLAVRRADYMGNANGYYTAKYSYDEVPNNQVTEVKNVNCTFKNERTRNTDWANGLNWVQYYDRYTLFYPAIQTIYSDDTSILNSDINMLIATFCNRVCFEVWRDLVGRSKLTNDQFIQRSNDKIKAAVKGRFDDRVVIVPDTYLSAMDELRGYSWSCQIHIYANNMKSVGVFTLVTHRQSDLAAGATSTTAAVLA